MATSMRPQPFCSLPWCGKSPGGPTKVRIIDGERLEYPEGIDAHHPFGRPGSVVYICHECHMRHHDGRTRLTFEERDGAWYGRLPHDAEPQPLRVLDEFGEEAIA